MQGKSVSEVCVRFIACIDALFRGYVTSKSLNNIHDFMFQLYCYVYLNLNIQKDIFLLSGKSQQIIVVWKTDRNARAKEERWFKSR